MELIASLTSPFARKIRVILEEKQLPYILHESIPWDADTDVGNYNPLGKVPALVDGGKTWIDSAVIAEFLETKESELSLIPKDPLKAVEVKHAEALADGICEAAINIFLERKRAPELQSQAWIERQQGKINNGLKYLNDLIGQKEFICHNTYSLGDIAVVCLMEWYSFRLPEHDWELEYPELARYCNHLGERVAFQSTRPE
ncbi:glutathione S-transferase N-terminal domain-containing protein [Litoribrevibacter albus]|uniref:Glutathione S-transferase n=1 Tax=Litoribrevibacter albus TaxID=1473156 RepID=A0AA37SBU0_9GAMM|nr:glutathione S-transferase N-terminal domain-containing protein [Litoribrevibacter albus]GLQ31819.1 glutathione S-transferase [Litoribrevibacter albus]